MKAPSTVLDTACNYIFYTYIITTCLIIFLVDRNVVSYGVDVANSIMPIIFLIILGVVFFVRYLTNKTNGKVKNILQTLTIFLMTFMILYYFMEDGFRII